MTLVLTFVFPVLLSKYLLSASPANPESQTIHISIVHTDFSGDSNQLITNLDRLKLLFRELKDNEGVSAADYILLPEYFFDEPLSLNGLLISLEVKTFRSYLKQHQSLGTRLIFGAQLNHDSKKYNAIVELDKDGVTAIYCKRRFIPFQERTPRGFEFLGVESEYFSFGKSTNADFTNERLAFTPILAICYESIYGEYPSGQLHELPQAIFMFSNEGFLNGSIGKDQYFDIIKLRAIEFGMPIARSSNQGYSAVISSDGRVDKISDSKGFSLISGTLTPGSRKTVYANYGNWLGILSLWLCVAEILRSIWVYFRIRN